MGVNEQFGYFLVHAYKNSKGGGTFKSRSDHPVTSAISQNKAFHKY